MTIEEIVANPYLFIKNLIIEIVPSNNYVMIEQLNQIFNLKDWLNLTPIKLTKNLNILLEETFPKINEKFPEVFANPTFDRFVIQIQRVSIFLMIESILNNPEFSNNDKISALNIIKENFNDVVFTNPDLKNGIQESINFIDEKLSKLIVLDNKLYYWEHHPDKLDTLYQLLLKEKMIDENKEFIKSFTHQNVNPKHRTTWNMDQTALFALLYLLNNKARSFKNDLIGTISFSLFKFKGEDKILSNTKSSFQKFTKRATDDNYFNVKHPKILEIISELNLSNK